MLPQLSSARSISYKLPNKLWCHRLWNFTTKHIRAYAHCYRWQWTYACSSILIKGKVVIKHYVSTASWENWMDNGLVHDFTDLIQGKSSCLITAYCSSWSHRFTWWESPHLFRQKWKIKIILLSNYFMNIGIKVFLSTSALSRIIFFIEYASLKKLQIVKGLKKWKINAIHTRDSYVRVTANGSPSGTATTTIVTCG